MVFKIYSYQSIIVLIILLLYDGLFSQNTIESRFDPPVGFQRLSIDKLSFGHYLRNLPLKPIGSKVKYHHGGIKQPQGIYIAVVDLAIGKKDLHQCADAIMRLKAEYLFKQKRYNDIHFNFTNGFQVDYSKWMQGFRIKTIGNKTSWVKKEEPSTSYETFWDYLEQVFMYAGTASLSKELLPVKIKELEIGDVFIKGGFPGHAVIVVDKAVNDKGEIAFILAQSYMPAQEIQILLNPEDINLSPWYYANGNENLITPQWTFTPGQLARFKS